VVALFYAGFVYYPKFNNRGTESAISWDVSGYYMYLPAILIYHDLKEQKFLPDIIEEYGPTPKNIQSYQHESGNYVMKYSMGQAITLSSSFITAHLWAKNDSRYPADGFSYPYQLCLALGCFLIAIIGLIYFRKVLLECYTDGIVALVLICIVYGSNYLEYAGISSGMTHNTLFMYYALLIWTTIRFHKSPTLGKALIIGGLVGIMALTRPTEILAALIPLLWGIGSLRLSEIKDRLRFFKSHRDKVIPAVIITGLIGCFQLVYWKYATGDWIVYSYQDEGFSWTSPHVWDCLFSYRSGWLIYSPMMILSLIGLWMLYAQRKALFWPVFTFSILFMYVTFAWDVWWYGGSLGQRAMVQSYPVLGIAMGALFAWIRDQKLVGKIGIGIFILLSIYLNLYWTHQGHKGGLLHVGQMTEAYFWKVIGSYDKNEEDLKLLDTDNNYEGERQNVQTLQPVGNLEFPTILNGEIQFSAALMYKSQNIDNKWIRVIADVSADQKEWDIWKMAQLVCKFKRGDQDVKYEYIRLYRILDGGERRSIHLDVKVPNAIHETLEVYFWNAGGDKTLNIHGVTVETFDEK